MKVFRSNQVLLWPFRTQVELSLILLAFSGNNRHELIVPQLVSHNLRPNIQVKAFQSNQGENRSFEYSSIPMSNSPSDSMGHSSRTHSSKIDSSQSDSLHQSEYISVKSSTAVAVQKSSRTVPDSSSVFREQSSRIDRSTVGVSQSSTEYPSKSISIESRINLSSEYSGMTNVCFA